jgi:hypothetical protein
MSKPNTELDAKIKSAIKDGISNTTGEWFNGFIVPGLNLTEEQSKDLLFYIPETNRLNKNIRTLITQEKIKELGEVLSKHRGFVYWGDGSPEDLDKYLEDRIATLKEELNG